MFVIKSGTPASSSHRLAIDSYGVLRVGNTHTQGTSGNTKRIALGAKGSIWGWTSGNINGALTLADNYYWDGSNNKAIENDYSAYLSLRSGSMRFGCTNQSHAAGANVSGGIHEKVRFENDGNVSIADGNLSFASGHGINFSATSDAPFGNTTNRQELLDDYEEGQWVPEYSGSTSAGSVSYSYRKGYYIKIGAQVTVWVEMTISSSSGMSGSTQISNLPFNKNDLGGNGANGSGTYYYSGTTNWYIQYHAQNKPIFTGWMPNNTNVIRIYNADHWGSVTLAPLNTNGRMSFSYTYTTSA